MYGLYIHYQIIFVYTARCYNFRQTMFIIQLCLTVIPLLYITTANADIFIGHAVEDFSVDSNATIMAFGNPQGACKFMFLDPRSNTTCCYSTNFQELCHTDRQSSSCRSPETAVVTASTNGCQLLLIKVQEDDHGTYDITFPKHTPNNVRNVQINVTSSPDDLIEEGTLILVAGGVGWITLALFVGFLVVKHYNNLVTEEETDV